MSKKRTVIFILLLLVVLMGTSCRQGLEERTKDNSDWKDYSNDYYAIKYPAKWNKAELDNNVGFAPVESESLGFDIKINRKEDVSSKQEFYNYIDQELKGFQNSTKLKEAKKITIQGQPAYKVVAINKQFNAKGTIISVYKSKAIFNLQYQGGEKEYEQNLSLAEEMLTSFQLAAFKSAKKTNKNKKVVQGRKLTAQEAREDAQYLWDRLEQIHPNLYYQQSKEEATKKFNEIETSLKAQNSWTKRELYNIWAPFVADFKDAHTVLSAGSIFRNYIKDGGKVFPVKLGIQNEELIVEQNFFNDSLPVGTTITAINGVSSEQLLKIMKEKTSHEREAFAYASIERRLLTHLWAKFDRVDQFEIEYKTDSTPKQITLDPVDYSYYNKLKESFNLEDKSEFSLSYPASQTALLTVDTFSKHKNQEFKQKIKSYFKEIQKKDVDNLIIDLRDNGGGSTSLVNYLYEFITPKPYLNFAQGEVKVSEYALRERSGNLSKLANLQEDRVEVKKPKLKKPSKNKYRFKGQVYVLIGPYTFSSATDFAALIKDFETGILVGQETGGLASSYGDKIRGQLSNSGLDFAVSYKKFVRPAGYDNGRGVIPDIKVENNYQEERNGIDQILNKALEQIEAK